MIEHKHNPIVTTTLRVLHVANLVVHMIGFVVLIFAATAAMMYAASVSLRKDQVTSHSLSASASHTITFALSSTNTFAAGESVVIDFHEDESRFVVTGAGALASSFSFNDGSARTIFSVTSGAASCVGSVGANDVAVGIADATGIITFLACPSYVASSSGASMTVIVGSGAGGADIIANPAIAGTYIIDITNAGGDCTVGVGPCDLGVVIVDDSSVVVSAEVSGASSGGGSSVPPADLVPPVISSILSSSITGTGATITWTTDEVSTSIVNYGTTASYGSTTQDGGFVSSHTIQLSGLSSATTYHYQVCSRDSSNNQSCSSDQTFTTLDESAPVISSVVVSQITATSATISWTTDETSNSFVDYGLVAGPPYSSVVSDNSSVTSHSLVVTGLTASTLYHFRVRSADSLGNEGVSSDATFSTIDTTAPVISNVQEGNITSTSLTITWDTNEAASSVVEFGLTESMGTIVSDGTLETAHTLNIVGLAPGTTYFYVVRSVDVSGNSGTTAQSTFTTALPDAPVISNVVITPGITDATITWNTSTPATSVLDYGRTASFGLTESSSTLVTSHSITLVGLVSDQAYLSRITSVDAFGQSVSVNNPSFTTLLDLVAPGLVTSLVATPGDTRISLSWTNPADADRAGTRVLRKVGTTPSSKNTDGTIVYEGVGSSHLDTGLVNGTTYIYTAFAFDASGNFSAGVSASATPVEGLVIPDSCSDTDGGLNYSLAGSTQGNNGTFSDSCSTGSVVIEYFCAADGVTVANGTHDCGSGFACDSGRCISESLVPSVAACGNGVCEESESTLLCPSDCPVVPVPVENPDAAPVATVAANERISSTEIEVRATSGAIVLRPENGFVSLYAGMTATIVIPDSAIQKEIRSAVLTINGSTYVMRETNSYETAIVVPNSLGTTEAVIVVTYADDTIDVVNLPLRIVSAGRVIDSGTQEPLSSARVEVYDAQSNTLWNASASGQVNPFVTGVNGEYRFVLPAGEYRFVVVHDGYRTLEPLSTFSVGAIFVRDFALIRLPTDEVLDQIRYFGDVVAQDVGEVVNNPEVESAVGNIAAPAAIAVAVTNVVAVGTATASLLPYLLSLMSFISQPTALFARRRRRQWGVVYNAFTKMPIDLAIVRLVDAQTNRVIRSMVTDKLGRYFFIAQPGKYRITVMRQGFVYPTAFLRELKEDAQYTDVYHGEDIEVVAETTITANIPVDPLVAEKPPAKIRLEKGLRSFQKTLALGSIGVLIVAAIITPTPLVLGMAAGNAVLYLAFRRVGAVKSPKSWGVVYDDAGKPLGSVIARIFDTRFNKLLETQVTDAKGRYSFLVGKNVYYVTYEKSGYEKQQYGPVDISAGDKQTATVAVDVSLKRQP